VAESQGQSRFLHIPEQLCRFHINASFSRLLYTLLFRLSGYRNVTLQMPTKRRLQNKPVVLGRKHAFGLAGKVAIYLNSSHGRPGADRVETVVRAINEIDRIVRNAGYPPNSQEILDEGGFGEVATQNMRVVDKFIKRFPRVLNLGCPRPEGWSTSYILSAAGRGESDSNAYYGATVVLDAAFHGYLRLIYQCASCGKWFVTKRADHKFCSANCRVKASRETPEGRAKRTQYMRGWRAGLKRRDEANLRVQARGGKQRSRTTRREGRR